MDINPTSQADVRANLDHRPWPFADACFERILCRHVLEHIADPVGFMAEVHRVARSGAIVSIVTPHFSNRYSYTDPPHRRHLAWRSFDCFTGESAQVAPTFWDRVFELRHPIPSASRENHFCMRGRFLRFGRPFRWLGVQWLANRFPDFYEHYLAFIFPARDLYVELEVTRCASPS